MAIVNRDLDASEKKIIVPIHTGALSTGVTLIKWLVPYPCVVKDVYAVGTGLSNSISVEIEDLTPTAGGFTLNSSIMAPLAIAVGSTVGAARASLFASGSTTLNLAQGDILILSTSGANGAAADANISLVISKLQDIVGIFGQQN